MLSIKPEKNKTNESFDNFFIYSEMQAFQYENRLRINGQKIAGITIGVSYSKPKFIQRQVSKCN